MFITNDFNFEIDHKSGLRKVVSNDCFCCRSCGKEMKLRDHCKRSIVQQGGTRVWILIRRFFCSECR